MTQPTPPKGLAHTRLYLDWMGVIVGVLGARLLASGLAFLGNLIVGRHLAPAAYGEFYLLFTVMSVVAGLAGPAIDTSLVRFAARHFASDRTIALPYFSFAFYLKLAIGAATLLLGIVLAAPLLTLLYGEDASHLPSYAILLAFVGGIGVSLWGFAQSYFQSREDFRRYSGFEAASSGLRLIMVLLLIVFDVDNVVWFLAAYVSAPFVIGMFAWTQLPREVFRAPTDWQTGREFFGFAKWVMLATIFTTVVQRADLLLLGILRVPEEDVGHYSAAVSLVLLGELVLLTFYSVLLPKASALREPDALRGFIGSFRVPSLVFCLGLGLMMPVAPWLVLLSFGPEYAGSEFYFILLLIGVIAAVGVAPAMTALYAVGQSHLVAWFEGVRLVLVLGLWAIPHFGAAGMAAAAGLVRAGVSAVAYVIAHQRVKSLMLAQYRSESE